MNTKFFFGSLAAIAAASLVVVSCGKTEGTSNSGGNSNATTPFSQIFVTAEGERVEGVVDHSARTITLTFAEATSFSAVKVEFEINSGWTCTFPTDLNNADFTNSPVLQFRSPSNSTVKYFVTITSNSLPIADASKITVKNYKGTVNFNSDEGVLTIYFDPSNYSDWKSIPPSYGYDATIKGLDRLLGNTQLVFGDGALNSGVTVENTKFDLFTNTSETLVLNSNGTKVNYTVKMDMSGMMGDPRLWGMSNVTTNYADENSGIEVWSGTSLPNVPIVNTIESSGEAYPETPWSWNYDGASSYSAFVFGQCGDWSLDRETETLDALEGVYVVYLDPEMFKAKMINNVDNEVAISDAASQGTVVVTGDACTHKIAIYNNNTLYKNTIADLADGNNESPSDIIAAGPEGTRATMGITSDGAIEFANAYYDGSSWQKYYRQVCWDNMEDYTGNTSNFSAWNVTAAATANPWAFRTGYAMNCWDMCCTDASHWEVAYGDAWNGKRARVYVGKTFDGRIGIAVFDCIGIAEWPWYTGIGSHQAAYVLRQLGWSDTAQIATDLYLENPGFRPTLYVNGKLVGGDASQVAAYALGFEKK